MFSCAVSVYGVCYYSLEEGVLLLMYATVLQIGGERYALSVSLFVEVPILAKQTLLIC